MESPVASSSPEAEDQLRDAMRAHGELIMNIAWKLTGSQDDASDVYQETFVKYLERLRKEVPTVEVRAWLSTVATNAAIDAVRRGRRLVGLSASLELSESEEQKSIDRIASQEITLLISRLPEKQKLALSLRATDFLSFAEIGSIMGCSEDAARANAYQGLKRLRQLLAIEKGQEHENR